MKNLIRKKEIPNIFVKGNDADRSAHLCISPDWLYTKYNGDNKSAVSVTAWPFLFNSETILMNDIILVCFYNFVSMSMFKVWK